MDNTLSIGPACRGTCRPEFGLLPYLKSSRAHHQPSLLRNIITIKFKLLQCHWWYNSPVDRASQILSHLFSTHGSVDWWEIHPASWNSRALRGVDSFLSILTLVARTRNTLAGPMNHSHKSSAEFGSRVCPGVRGLGCCSLWTTLAHLRHSNEIVHHPGHRLISTSIVCWPMRSSVLLGYPFHP